MVLSVLWSALLVALYAGVGTAQAAPGDLDTSFAAGHGFVVLPQLTSAASDETGGMVLQPDSRIVVVGTSQVRKGPSTPFVVRLLNPTGVLDPSFGAGTGVSRPDIEAGVPNTQAGTDHFTAVAMQPDGRLVVAGDTQLRGTDDVLVERLLADGALDKSYGLGSGGSAPDFGGQEEADAVVLQRDGKVVVSGTGDDINGVPRFLVARFNNPAGTLDSSYGLSTGASRPTAFAGRQIGVSVAVQPSDGKILVAGDTIPDVNNLDARDFLVARFQNPQGTSDTGFGSLGGAEQTDLGGTDDAHAMVLQPDGKILVAGSTDARGTDDFAVIRLLSNGTPDNSFGTGGKAIVDLGGDDVATSIALQPNGKIVVAGSTRVGTSGDVAVARLQPDGSPDTTFGRAGKSILDFGADEAATGLAVERDGHIVVAGEQIHVPGPGQVLVARLQGDPVGSGGHPKVPRCHGRLATIVGTNRADKLTGTGRSDVIVGLGGNDTIKGLGAGDVICGGDGNDTIAGGAGNDWLSGGSGKDRISGGAGNDTLVGGPGRDKLSGGPGRDKTEP
jgi:uncharacterized delta-60 repeat protein